MDRSNTFDVCSRLNTAIQMSSHQHSTSSLSWYRVGQDGDIQLSGQFILEDHCTIVNENGIFVLYNLPNLHQHHNPVPFHGLWLSLYSFSSPLPSSVWSLLILLLCSHPLCPPSFPILPPLLPCFIPSIPTVSYSVCPPGVVTVIPHETHCLFIAWLHLLYWFQIKRSISSELCESRSLLYKVVRLISDWECSQMASLSTTVVRPAVHFIQIQEVHVGLHSNA